MPCCRKPARRYRPERNQLTRAHDVEHHCRRPGRHCFGLIDGAQPRTLEGGEQVDHHIDGVGGEAPLGIIGEADAGKVKLMQIVTAGWVSAGRDRDTQTILRAAACKLRHQPAIRLLVVENHRVAGIGELALPAQASEKDIARNRTQDGVT